MRWDLASAYSCTKWGLNMHDAWALKPPTSLTLSLSLSLYTISSSFAVAQHAYAYTSIRFVSHSHDYGPAATNLPTAIVVLVCK